MESTPLPPAAETRKDNEERPPQRSPLLTATQQIVWRVTVTVEPLNQTDYGRELHWIRQANKDKSRVGSE